MKRGILVYNHDELEWEFGQGNSLIGLRRNIFLNLEKFILHPNEVYKVRVNIQDYIRLDAPFQRGFLFYKIR